MPRDAVISILLAAEGQAAQRSTTVPMEAAGGAPFGYAKQAEKREIAARNKHSAQHRRPQNLPAEERAQCAVRQEYTDYDHRKRCVERSERGGEISGDFRQRKTAEINQSARYRAENTRVAQRTAHGHSPPAEQQCPAVRPERQIEYADKALP